MAHCAKRISASRVMRGVTLNVTLTGMRVWRARVYVMLRLIRLAAWIGGVGIVVDGPYAPGGNPLNTKENE